VNKELFSKLSNISHTVSGATGDMYATLEAVKGPAYTTAVKALVNAMALSRMTTAMCQVAGVPDHVIDMVNASHCELTITLFSTLEPVLPAEFSTPDFIDGLGKDAKIIYDAQERISRAELRLSGLQP
jgi:hypothetical protein